AGGKPDLAVQAEDGSGAQTRKDFALQPDGGIANAAVPSVVLVLKREWDRHLDLVFYSEALLVDCLVRHPWSALRVKRCRIGDLILRIGLLGNQRARKVQFGTRPVGIRAETSQVSNDFVDLIVPKRLAE